MSKPLDLEYSDRYTILGPPNGCAEQCEGTGFVPIYMSKGDKRDDSNLATGPDEDNPLWIAAWEKAEETNPADDGWHFVQCPACADD